MKRILILIIFAYVSQLCSFGINLKDDIYVKAFAFSALEINENKQSNCQYTYLDSKRIELGYKLEYDSNYLSLVLLNKEELKNTDLELNQLKYYYKYKDFKIGYELTDMEYSFKSEVESLSPRLPYFNQDVLSNIRFNGAVVHFHKGGHSVIMNLGGNQLDTGIFSFLYNIKGDFFDFTANYINTGRDEIYNQFNHHFILKNKLASQHFSIKLAADLNLIDNDYEEGKYFVNRYFIEGSVKELLDKRIDLLAYYKLTDYSDGPNDWDNEQGFALALVYRMGHIQVNLINKRSSIFSEQTCQNMAIIKYQLSEFFNIGVNSTLTNPPYGDSYYDAGMQIELNFN